jgi:hypothetical protein
MFSQYENSLQNSYTEGALALKYWHFRFFFRHPPPSNPNQRQIINEFDFEELEGHNCKVCYSTLNLLLGTYLCAIMTFKGLGCEPIQQPFISSRAKAASDVFENLM